LPDRRNCAGFPAAPPRTFALLAGIGLEDVFPIAQLRGSRDGDAS